ncbi:hypothetical protein [Leptospira ilyithenensis]|uniref:Uncharacterized protein n=1 Tax=Leptospira ilyithenensis TaxID=2484901 RepID=A0A4R9LWC9_9LEPT|nr:hypothetical protein [Leptospira ilyithenensis]TGN14350.1 hypothetical protein EHS11_02440 [Leptospira ilyithenensis]
MKLGTFFLCFLLTQCQKSLEDQFDELKNSASVFRLARFCEENKILQSTKEKDCSEAFQASQSRLEAILSRQIDLSFTKLILPKEEGEEIELLLRTKPEWGIRYLEIWKQSVILE